MFLPKIPHYLRKIQLILSGWAEEVWDVTAGPKALTHSERLEGGAVEKSYRLKVNSMLHHLLDKGVTRQDLKGFLGCTDAAISQWTAETTNMSALNYHRIESRYRSRLSDWAVSPSEWDDAGFCQAVHLARMTLLGGLSPELSHLVPRALSELVSQQDSMLNMCRAVRVVEVALSKGALGVMRRGTAGASFVLDPLKGPDIAHELRRPGPQTLAGLFDSDRQLLSNCELACRAWAGPYLVMRAAIDDKLPPEALAK